MNELTDMEVHLISRQAAIDVLEERLQANGYSNVALVSELNRSIGYLMRLPTVDAVPVRHGIFIGTEYDGYADGCPVYYEWKCSECGTVFEDEEPNYNYCPNCGARMDE